MTDAMSRLTDVDMAEEMTNYTQYNVLQQGRRVSFKSGK